MKIKKKKIMLLKERRKKIRYLLTLFILFSFNSKSYAEDKNIITIDDVYKSVDEFYPSVNITRKERDIADSKLLASQGEFDTTFNAKSELRPLGYYNNGLYDVYIEQPTTLWGMNFFSGWRLGVGKFADYEGKSVTNSLGEYRTGFEIPLLKDGFTDRRRTNIVQAELKQSEAELKTLKKRIESRQQSAIKYWKWVGAVKNYYIIQEILDIAIKRDKNIEDTAKLGNIPPIESVENKRVIYQRKASMISAQRSVEQSANDLSIYFRNNQGLPIIPKISQVPDKIEFKNNNIVLESSFKRAFDNNPELKIVTNTLESMNVELDFLNNQRLPEIDIIAAISQDIGTGDKSRDPFVFETGFKVKAPLWLRSADGKINERKALIDQTLMQYNFIKEQVRVEVQNAYISLTTAYQQLELAKQELSLSLKLEEAEKEKFKLGDSNILFINIREQTTADAKIREINSIINYNQALADYKASISEL
jgi:cobalt-zinc-cadmium efflux system outer membrane protein